jgi:hypothetical protein
VVGYLGSVTRRGTCRSPFHSLSIAAVIDDRPEKARGCTIDCLFHKNEPDNSTTANNQYNEILPFCYLFCLTPEYGLGRSHGKRT